MLGKKAYPNLLGKKGYVVVVVVVDEITPRLLFAKGSFHLLLHWHTGQVKDAFAVDPFKHETKFE